MKKSKAASHREEVRPEYEFRGGMRGKYASRYSQGTNMVVLDADVARVFRDSKAVNEALRALARIASKQTRRTASG